MFGAPCSALGLARRAVSRLLVVAAAAGAAGCFAHQYRSKPRVAVVDGDPIVQMRRPGEFPAVTKPSLVAPDQHSDPPDEDSQILGLTVGAVPRAYPIGLLDRFEVVNDSVPDLPFVVARCALTGVTAVYDRRVGQRVLEFQNSGALWRDTLVLRDRATGTDWSAATGTALHGPLAGQRLRPIPAVVVRAGDWQRAFPASLIMDLDSDTSVPLFMRIYGASPWQGISGEKTADSRHRPKDEVLTIGEDDEAVAFTAGEIEAAGRVDTILRGEPISIRWDATLEAPRAYGPGGDERAVVPMYWFAAARNFARVRTLLEKAENGSR
ncbi:MAG TPA: DUF3179 domain-containing (seleno)protein [Thermoanaerobaculia bacterium]|nr:DUF3179 domain-containing (seleno)protein [Thermoanaerobaculia bacterium]